jgi:DNA-binding transcriptional LysR family regulator
MELRQLRDFIAIAEEHGFHKAARRLHVAQPALSAFVKQLEEEPGHTLLLPGRDIAPAALALASVARELSAGSGSVPRSIPPERTDRPATHRRIRHS